MSQGSEYIVRETDNAGADIEGQILPIPGGLPAFSFQINTFDLNAADASITVEESNDGLNWIEADSPDLPIVLATSTDINKINVIQKVAKNYRIVYTKNSVTTGDIEVILSF